MKPALKLHKPHGTNRYCGPTVLSALTGLSTDDVAAVVRLVNPSRTAVKAMHDSELLGALKRLGGSGNHMAFGGFGALGKLTLQQWMDQRSEAVREKVLVVTAGMHYMLVRKDLVLCTHTRGEWVNILSHPFRRKRFISAIMVTPPAGKAVLPDGVLAKRKAQAQDRKAASSGRARALALAAKLHLEFERDNDYIITSMAASGLAMWRELLLKAGDLNAWDNENDDVGEAFYNEVLCGDSYGRDWAEALTVVERVADYARKVTGIIA